MERDEFLAALIAALQENAELASAAAAPLTPAVSPSSSSPSSSSSSPAAASSTKPAVTGLFRERWRVNDALGDDGLDNTDACEAHARLQFDFPQLTDAQLLALAALYRRVAQGEGSAAQQLPVTNALVAGVVYLSEQAGDATSSPEARGLLAAALLLLLPARCLKFADQVRTRALLSRVVVPQAMAPLATATTATATSTIAADSSDDRSDAYVEKYAAEEDPDDLSQVYEGSAPTTGRSIAALSAALGGSAMATGASSGAFADKLQFLASRTFSSAFMGISCEKWDEWGLDRCLVDIVQHLLVTESSQQQQQQQQQRRLYGHPHGEWTRYLYILRDRVLRFPNVSRGGIQALKDLVALLQPAMSIQQQQQSRKTATAVAVGRDDGTGSEIQLPHHLVYRVLAELVLSKELQQRSSQPAQRELATALHALVPCIVREIQRLGALRQASSSTGSRALESSDELAAPAAADENDDLILILTQLVHFLLFVSPSKRITADKLQESGVLRALLSLVPADLAVAHAAMTSKRFWFTPLVRLVAECGVWNVEFAEYVIRVPKFAALLPAMREQFPAELSLLLVAFYHHELQSAATVQALVISELDGGTSSRSSSSQLWDVFVSSSLFPLSCTSYLDSMTKVRRRWWWHVHVVEP